MSENCQTVSTSSETTSYWERYGALKLVQNVSVQKWKFRPPNDATYSFVNLIHRNDIINSSISTICADKQPSVGSTWPFGTYLFHRPFPSIIRSPSAVPPHPTGSVSWEPTPGIAQPNRAASSVQVVIGRSQCSPSFASPIQSNSWVEFERLNWSWMTGR